MTLKKIVEGNIFEDKRLKCPNIEQKYESLSEVEKRRTWIISTTDKIEPFNCNNFTLLTDKELKKQHPKLYESTTTH